MVWYEYRHPGDTSQLVAIARILPTVQTEWGTSTLAKGWLYFLFQRVALFSGNSSFWTATMQNWVNGVGYSHGPITDSGHPLCPDGYRVDEDFENGLALIDAGTRFNHPEWVQAGAREVSVVQQQAFVTRYQLFVRVICQGNIWDSLARAPEIGQEAEVLLDVGNTTSNQTYLTLAQKMLDTIVNPASGFRDPIYGGI